MSFLSLVLLILIPLWLSVKLIQIIRKPQNDSPHFFEGHEPNKENWKLIIKYSLIVGLCFGLLSVGLGDRDNPFFHFVGVALVLVVPALAVGKKVAFRRFFHAGAIGIIGSSLGVPFSVFLFVYLKPLLLPDAPSDYAEEVMWVTLILCVFGIISSFFMGCLASLAGKSYDKKRGVHPPGQG